MIRHLGWCVVVGCCVRTYGIRCLVFGDTLFLIFPSASFSSIFRLSLYMHVRTCFSWSRRCMCSTVFQGGAAGRYTLGTPREIFEFQFCECDSVNEIR